MAESRRDLTKLESNLAATRAQLAQNEAHIKQLLSTQVENMREVIKSGVLSIKAEGGLWKQFLFALYADGEFAWYRPRSKPDDPAEGSLQVVNLNRIVVLKNPHYLRLTSPLEKVELWCNSIPEVSTWARAISKVKSHLDAASEAYHIAVTHDNVEACYNERMKGIQQVKAALEHERLVNTKEGPVLLTAPSPGPYTRSMAAHWPQYYRYDWQGAPLGLAGEQLDHFAENLYDDIETDLKAHNGASHPSFAWMAQDINPAAPLGNMDDAHRVAESLRRARLADRNAKEAFDRFEQGVAGTLAHKISKDTGMEVSVATPTPSERFLYSGYYPYAFDGISSAQRIMASRGIVGQPAP
jgi:hypothetical protein